MVEFQVKISYTSLSLQSESEKTSGWETKVLNIMSTMLVKFGSYMIQRHNFCLKLSHSFKINLILLSINLIVNMKSHKASGTNLLINDHNYSQIWFIKDSTASFSSQTNTAMHFNQSILQALGNVFH